MTKNYNPKVQNKNLKKDIEYKKNQFPNNILESFKSGFGFGSGIEIVRGLSNSESEQRKTKDKCSFENSEYKKCIQNNKDVFYCIDVLEKLKICNENNVQ